MMSALCACLFCTPVLKIFRHDHGLVHVMYITTLWMNKFERLCTSNATDCSVMLV